MGRQFGSAWGAAVEESWNARSSAGGRDPKDLAPGALVVAAGFEPQPVGGQRGLRSDHAAPNRDCPTDLYEPNEGFAGAYNLGSLDCFRASELWVYTGIMMGADADADFFRFSPNTTGAMTIGTLFSHAKGDISLIVYDSAEDPLAMGLSYTDNEFVTVNVTEGATYYVVKLLPFTFLDPACTEYELLIGLQDDSYEDNDTFADAFPLQHSACVRETELAVCEQDEDWYEHTASSDGTITVEALFSHLYGDIDLRVYDSVQQLLGEGVTNTDNESVTVDVVGGETYFIRLNHVPTLDECGCNEYDLRITPDDIHEDNDSREQGAALEMAACLAETNLWIQDGDDDWYRLQAHRDGPVTIEVSFRDDAGNIDLEVQRRRFLDWELLAESTSTTNNESVVVDLNEGDTFVIPVYLNHARDACTHYALFITGEPEVTLDTDGDEDIDLVDYAEFQRQFTGPVP